MIADEQTLSRLMAASQTGDKQAYRTLLEEVQHWLRRYFARRIASGQADDLIQEVLMALHAKRASYDPARPFLPWLAAIARYRWIDHLRKVYRSDEQALDGEEQAVPGEQDAALARISLERLFLQLSPAQARAIEMVKIEGHSIREAAASCGQSEPLVKVNIHRGLRKLAALIEKAD